MLSGMIMKSIAGFYYVEVGDLIYECKARGSFRKNGESPLVGDNVVISETDKSKGVIEKISSRKNALLRPPIANLDRLFIVSSVADPSPNLFILDQLTAIAVSKDIEPIILINKCDLSDGEWIAELYRSAGFTAITLSAKGNFENIFQIKNMLKGKISAFTGNSGVGKSSILNLIDERLTLAVGEISVKLGRGKHTTRHVELLKICDGYVADTPGFSSIDIEQCEHISHENLSFCFPEFLPYLTKCKFTSCSHTSEKGCAILEAVNKKIIKQSRLDNYCQMYEKSKKVPNWLVKR